MINERNFWNKLRILVTNKCNYRCPFCHNEGQEKEGKTDVLSLKDFVRFIEFVKEQDISELHFSGGEPFLNNSIVDMIEYVDINTAWGIGCATNLSIITDEQIQRLSKTRIKFNIQFPFANSSLFKLSTGNGDFQHITNQIKKVQKAGICIGLNSVVQSGNIEDIKSLISFAIEHQLPLKLLPQIGLEGSKDFKNQIYPLLQDICIEVKDKGTGALRWVVERDGKQTVILYIDSPCFDHDIDECREFGELRVHPDLSIQPCIFKMPTTRLNLDEGKETVLNQMANLWSDFKHC